MYGVDAGIGEATGAALWIGLTALALIFGLAVADLRPGSGAEEVPPGWVLRL